MSTTEVEVRLGVGRAQLLRLIREGEVPAYRIGNRFRFRRAEIDAVLGRARELARVEALLDFGVRVENRWVANEAVGDSHHEDWVVVVLGDALGLPQ